VCGIFLRTYVGVFLYEDLKKISKTFVCRKRSDERENASFFSCDDDDDSRFVFDDVEFLEVFSEKRRWQQEQREEDGDEDVFWKSPNDKKMESPIERHFVYRKEQ
jgi:hypothetical protein